MLRLGKFTLIVAIILVACSGAPISKKNMENIMVDAMLLEAGNQVRYNAGLIPAGKWKKDYAIICQKHGVDTTEFKKALTYYTQHPKLFAQVMDKVVTQLQEKQLNIQKQK